MSQHSLKHKPGSHAHQASAPPLPSPVASAVAAAFPKPAPLRRARFRTPFLGERAGWYYFVRRYPKVFIDSGLFKRPFCRKSLGTRHLLEAERRVRQLAVRFDNVMQRLALRAQRRSPGVAARDPSALPRDVVRASDIPQLAARFEAMLLHSDDVDRGDKLAVAELEEYVRDIEVEQRQLRLTNACGDVQAHADVVDGFLEAEGLTRPADDKDYRELCRTMLHSQLKSLRTVLERLDGTVAATPAPPPALRGVDDLDDMSKALAHWVAKARPARKSLMEIEPVWKRLQVLTGKTRISALTRDDMIHFQTSEQQRRVGKRLTRPQTVNKKLALLSAVFSLVCDDALRGWGVVNPLEGFRRLAVKSGDYIHKQDLSTEELSLLFGGPVHTQQARPVGGAGEASYWLPVLGYATGARMGELAQLRVNDVVQRDGVWSLWLTTREDEDVMSTRSVQPEEVEAQFQLSLKTGHSRRLVPLHRDVLRLGFLQYVEWVRAQASPQLFPDIRPDNKGTLAGNFSKWFNGYLRKVAIKRRGLDWISFRHTFKTACRSLNMKQDVADYLEGHAAGRASQNYGQFKPQALQDALSGIELPGLAKVQVWSPPEHHREPRLARRSFHKPGDGQ